MIKKLRAILVEDEPWAIKGFEKYIQKNKFIELIAVCQNAMEAAQILDSQHIELMFLDIHMPKITGLDFLNSIKKKPITIITSAVPPSTLNLVGLNVQDYLVKPTSIERFNAAVAKVYSTRFGTLNQ